IADTTERGVEALALRRRYEENVEREAQILSLALSQVEDTGLVRKIEKQRAELKLYEQQLAAFNARLQAVVDERSQDILQDIMVQKRILDSLGSDSDSTRQVAQQVVGQVAVDSLAEVQNQFRDIVLRADVGIVDVAWAEKEATTREITENVTEQRRELERFDAEFREVLVED
ncbi:MAG: hypothetical protein AAF658_18055, partial [Myxococcota bacterium]